MQRLETKLVTDQGLSMALSELHKPELMLFYWQGTDADQANGRMVLKKYDDLFSWDGVVTIPAYTLGEILELLPERIKGEHIAEVFKLPLITAPTGEEWEEQNEAREKAIDKLGDALSDYGTNTMYEMSEYLMDSEQWDHDLKLVMQPGEKIYYISDEPDAEYWVIAIEMEIRDKHDKNPAHLAGRLLQHCLKHGLVKGDDGQGVMGIE